MITIEKWESNKNSDIQKGMLMNELRSFGFIVGDELAKEVCEIIYTSTMDMYARGRASTWFIVDEARDIIADFARKYSSVLKLLTRSDHEINETNNRRWGRLKIVDSTRLEGYREIDISNGKRGEQLCNIFDCNDGEAYIKLIENIDPKHVYQANRSNNMNRVSRLPNKIEVVMFNDKVVGFATDDKRFIAIA